MAHAGEPHEFEPLVRRFWEPLVRFFWKRVAAADVHDLVQDVFVSSYRAFRSRQSPPLTTEEAWSAFLFTCARNHLSNYYRRRQSSPRSGRLDEYLAMEESPTRERLAKGDQGLKAAAESSRPDPLISGEQRRFLRECMERLDEVTRAICWLHFVDGRSKREIARSLEVPESSLRLLIVKALADLRKCLESKGVSESVT